MRELLPKAPLLMVALVCSEPAFAQQDTDGDDGPGRPVTEITITARRLDAARANIEPSLGASTYTLTNDTVEARPGGETTTISQILLQAPGVAQDGSGQLRVRQSLGNLQYRINNVILPDGLTDLGESLSPRIAAKVQLVTGALPAQYGLLVSGVVNVTTKDGVYLNGGQAEIYGGSHNTLEPAFEYGGSAGNTNFFVSGSYQRNDVGIASPDGSGDPLHDRTRQIEGFAFVDHVIDPQTRISLILGGSDERFQLPNLRGLNAATADLGPVPFQRSLVLRGVSNFPSEQRDGQRRDINRYGVVSLLHTNDKVTLQASGFLRYSAAMLAAQGTGDVLFTGVGRTSRDTTSTIGAQVEGVYELAEAHTLRGGFVVISDKHNGSSQTLALPINAQGQQTSDIALSFTDNTHLAVLKDSLFLQDEWRPSDFVTINIGARIDHVKAGSYITKLSPRASLVWAPKAGTTLHAGYARYFLPAPIEGASDKPTELAATSARPPTLSGDALKPEFDDYYDLGLEQSLGDFTFGIDAYWREAINLIDEGQFGAAYQAIAFNYDHGRIRGVELSATYTANRLSGWANVAIADARARGIGSNQYYFTAPQLAYAATHMIATSGDQRYTISGGVSYRWDKLRLSADLLAGSGFRRTLSGGTPNGDHMPGYVQLNVSAVFRLATIGERPLDVRFDVINAFDEKYQLRDGTGLAAGQVQWGPRRGVFVGIEQAF